MTLCLTNTMKRRKEPFVPANPARFRATSFEPLNSRRRPVVG